MRSVTRLNQAERPWWLRGINTIGSRVESLGIGPDRFNANDLMRIACEQTNLTDFGNDAFHEPLEMLVSATHRPDVSFFGRLAMRDSYLRLLANRL